MRAKHTVSETLLIHSAAHLWTGLRGAAMRATGGIDVRVRDGRIAAIGTLAPEAVQRSIDAGAGPCGGGERPYSGVESGRTAPRRAGVGLEEARLSHDA